METRVTKSSQEIEMGSINEVQDVVSCSQLHNILHHLQTGNDICISSAYNFFLPLFLSPFKIAFSPLGLYCAAPGLLLFSFFFLHTARRTKTNRSFLSQQSSLLAGNDIARIACVQGGLFSQVNDCRTSKKSYSVPFLKTQDRIRKKKNENLTDPSPSKSAPFHANPSTTLIADCLKQ